jgi:hypothetical protein
MRSHVVGLVGLLCSVWWAWRALGTRDGPWLLGSQSRSSTKSSPLSIWITFHEAYDECGTHAGYSLVPCRILHGELGLSDAG